MAWLVIGLACLSVFYFMLDSNLVNSTIEPESNYENYDAKNTTFETAKTNVSNLSYDIYYQMMVGNTIIPVKISSLGNPVSNINYDNEEKSIILVINSLNEKIDKLIIDIPRIILDSKVNGNDKNFTVLADDQPAKFLEIKNPDKGKPILNSTIGNISAVQYSNNTESRKLMVEFESNTKIIEIIGTDTTLANNQSIDNSTQNNTIPEEDRNLGNFVFPIISIIVSLVGISLFFYFRKNKAHLMNKFKPK